MMTQSQIHLRMAEACCKEMDELQKQINMLEGTMRGISEEERYARNKYNEEYRAELMARRSYVPEQPRLRLSMPNPVPHDQCIAWNALQKKVMAHPSFKHGSPVNEYGVLVKLMRFNQKMAAICNTQAWNPRNPNPHLP